MEHTNSCGGRTPPKSVISKLSQIAFNGKHPSNAERDMHNVLKQTALDVEIEFCDVRFWQPSTGQLKVTKFPFIFPDRLALKIWELGEEYFQYYFFGDQDAAVFWQHVQHHEWAAGHVAHAENLARLAPITFYGDDVHTYKNTEVGVISVCAWSTDYFTREHLPLDRYFLISAFSEYLATEETWGDCMQHLSARFASLVGRRDWPWSAAGYGFAMSSCTGDLKWLKEHFGVHNYNQNSFCGYCSCKKVDPGNPSNTLGDFSDTAHHRQARFGHDEFWAATDPNSRRLENYLRMIQATYSEL